MVAPEIATATELPAEIEAYCVKCKTNRTMNAAQAITTKNGRVAAKGKCPVCGTTMMKFMPSK